MKSKRLYVLIALLVLVAGIGLWMKAGQERRKADAERRYVSARPSIDSLQLTDSERKILEG